MKQKIRIINKSTYEEWEKNDVYYRTYQRIIESDGHSPCEALRTLCSQPPPKFNNTISE